MDILSILVIFFICKTHESGASGATFTFVNNCDQTVWPGLLGSPKPDTTGFELPKGGSRALLAPAGWSGRVWGRTGCDFNGSGQRGSCLTGDCGSGQVECNGSGATPPATLVEFTLGSVGSQDFYDVSLVDGYNLPVMVGVSGGSGACASTGCTEDLNKKCPKELRIQGGGACRSACDAFGTPEYCCKGAYGSPSTCAPSVYSQVFKSACPKSYSYAYDDASSTFTCTGADYTITFCPPSSSKKSSQSSNSTNESGLGSTPNSNPEANSTPGPGSGLGSSSKSEPPPGSGTEQAAEAMWLAYMATGDSRGVEPLGLVQILAFIVSLTSLTLSFDRYFVAFN